MPSNPSRSASSTTAVPLRKRTSSTLRSRNKAAASGVDESQRAAMIAEAAYFRAAQRDFESGDPVDDWLAAEEDIERRLNGG